MPKGVIARQMKKQVSIAESLTRCREARSRAASNAISQSRQPV